MVTAIVAAAGKGRRFGAPENKVFAPLAGEPVLLRTLRTLSDSAVISSIVIVTGAEDLPRVRDLVAGTPKLHTVCEGGAERYDSVWNALRNVPEGTQYVAVHDAARPLASADLIARVVQAARQSGAAVPATPIADTVKHSEDGQTTRQTVDRSTLYAVQTPQVFGYDLLVEAYRHARETAYTGTDDASFIEHLGHPVTLVPGERHNLKITVEADLQQAEALVRMQHPVPGIIRTGFGYDVHRLVPGRPLFLGGVELQHPDGLGLDGHSDADVLLHAISDALLGAAALGDIGQHFPNTDPRYHNVSSLLLLREVGVKLREAGWEPVNVDAMLLAERPKIRPHVDEMRRRIAEALGVTVDQVSVKATTNETLGFEGAEKGMCAHAVATITRTTV